MNKSDSESLSCELERLGLEEVGQVDAADIIVLNSCAVRQSAENKVINKLSNLKALKKKKPDTIIVLTGCMVEADVEVMRNRFPYIDFFLKPQEFGALLEYVENRSVVPRAIPSSTRQHGPTAFVPIIQGCNNFCTYCIVPYRRGREKSRPVDEIMDEVKNLVENGVKEVTLLGQNVDSYGHDLPDTPDLADLLENVNRINGLSRIRFLTSHPKDMSQKLIEAIASLDKVCEHISLPAQAGDNQVLEAMHRGYNIEQYKDLLSRITTAIPAAALSTDIIVGFPGESAEQFQRTYKFLEEFRFDTVHAAAYSPRSGTIAYGEMEDDVKPEDKQRRLNQVEELQERISIEKNSCFLGQVVEVLVEDQRSGKWMGRTRSDKLVFFESEEDCLGYLVHVQIEHAGPWSLQGIPIEIGSLV